VCEKDFVYSEKGITKYPLFSTPFSSYSKYWLASSDSRD
jgi:hypothetical protein